MSTTRSERKFASRMAILAGKEAKKLGLSPKRFNGAFSEDAFIFEVEFEPTLKHMDVQGNA